MGEKLFLLLVVFSVALAALALNQNAINNQQGAPLKKLIDFTKVLKVENWNKAKKDESGGIYKFEFKTHLRALQEKRNDSEKKRLQLVQSRMDMMSELSGINTSVKDSSREFLLQLNKYQKGFSAKSTELTKLGWDLKQAYRSGDAEIRKAKIDLIRDEIVSLFGLIQDDPEQSLPRITPIINEITQLMIEGDAAVIEACPNNYKCLSEDISALQKIFKQYVSLVVDEPRRFIEKIVEKAKFLEYENIMLVNNCRATEELLWEGGQRLESEFTDMVERIVDVNDNSLMTLIDFHGEMYAEQALLYRNLEANRSRYYNAQIDFSNDVNPMIDELRETISKIGIKKFTDLHDENRAKRKEILQKFDKNEFDIKQYLTDAVYDRKEYIFQIADSANIDLEALLEERRLAEEEQRVRSAQTKMRWKQVKDRDEEMQKLRLENQQERNRNLMDQKRLDYDEAMMLQKLKQEEINRKMDRQRNKARDSGFYN